MIKQRTIKRIVKTTGIGLHTGKKINLMLIPASINHGVIYRRIDLKPPIDFLINANTVCNNTKLSTCLINQQGIKILTVEHLNAALSSFGIDNILIEVNAPEIPIMDGSADHFTCLIINAGIKELNSAKKFIKIKKTIKIKDGDKWVKIKPYNGFFLDFTISFDHPAINSSTQHYQTKFSTKIFISEISKARTFGFLRDIKYLKSHGLCLGGSLDCAIIVDDYNILNKKGLRYSDEFVRHKALDAVGDLFMCGYNIIGHFQAFKSGHALNNQLLRKLINTKKSWELVTFTNKKELPINFI